MPSRIYEYGAVLIVDGKPQRSGVAQLPQSMEFALRWGNMYRNKLVEITKGDEDGYRERRRKWSPRCDELEEVMEALRREAAELRKELRARRQRENATAGRGKRGKRTRYPDIEDRLAEIAAETKRLKPHHKKAKEQYDIPIKEWDERWSGRAGARAIERGYAVQNAAGKVTVINKHGKSGINEEITKEMLTDPGVPEMWKEHHRAKEDARKRRWLARAWSRDELQSGTKGLVDAAVNNGATAVRERRKKGEACELQFRAYRDEGRIGVHYSSDTTWEAMCKATQEGQVRLRLVPSPDRGTRKQRYECRVPVAAGRKPETALFHVTVHRPLPAGTRIKDAWILVRTRGVRSTFRLQLACNVPEQSVARVTGPRGTAALHLAYRRESAERVRVGYLDADVPLPAPRRDTESPLVPEGDMRGPIYIPVRAIERTQQAAELRSKAAVHWDEIRDRAIEWVSGEAEPEVRAACRNIVHWRNPIKLARILVERDMGRHKELWKQWLDERRPAGLDLWPGHEVVERWATVQGADDPRRVAMLWWARKHLHLIDWAERNQTRAIAQRNELFRVLAAWVRAHVRDVLVDDQDLRAAKKKAAPEKQVKLTDEARALLQLASPGKLRSTFEEVFGDDAHEVAIAGFARRCHECGADVAESGRAQVACEGGHGFDRDGNVTKHMLNCERPGAHENPGGARSSVGGGGSVAREAAAE